MQIRAFTDIFFSKAFQVRGSTAGNLDDVIQPQGEPTQLRDIFSLEVTRNRGSVQVNMYEWAHRMTLDVIGEAGMHTLHVKRVCDRSYNYSHSIQLQHRVAPDRPYA